MAIKLAGFLTVALLHGARGHGFLAANPKSLALNSLRGDLHEAITGVLGHGHGIHASRIAYVKDAVAPLFRSLPKSEESGFLSPAVMRYAVQRYFSQQHGWIMKGFEPHASGGNASDLADGGHILQSKVPDFVRIELERKISRFGFRMESATVLIAVLERLILDEVVTGMELAFSLKKLQPTQALDRKSLMDVLRSFFINEILQERASYPYSDETNGFFDDLVSNDVFEHRQTRNPFSEKVFFFDDAVRVSQRFSEEFGSFSNHECDTMKGALSKMDPHETGRVKMAEFYKRQKGGAWQFKEAFEYLRQIGAIDESSVTLGPQVIIPNYIAGVNNCITSKQYYSICCLNECNAVYQHLEAVIQAPYATPAEIIPVVEVMPNMADGKNLSMPLRNRLEQISYLHDGSVPLHGRLFAQWLHFVFPQDCPYPHMIGSINPQSQKQFEMVAGAGTSATNDEEISQFLASESAKIAPSPEAGLLMWNLQEALLDTTTSPEQHYFGAGDARWLLRMGAVCGLLACAVFFVLKESHRILEVIRPDVKAVHHLV